MLAEGRKIPEMIWVHERESVKYYGTGCGEWAVTGVSLERLAHVLGRDFFSG